MMRPTKILLLAVLLAGVSREAWSFSLHGQFKTWQVTALGYQLPGDVGGPQLGNEGYRWNVPTIYYAFDQSFITYFGQPGMTAVNSAIKVFNGLPPMSSITNDGFELFIRGEPVPTDSKGPPNFQAGALGLLDLKSYTMQAMLEEMGLVSPTRYTYTLRGRNTETIGGVVITNYSVVKLNFDPVTLQPSSYVNGGLLVYSVVEPIMIQGITYADAVEDLADQTDPYFSAAVADFALAPGQFFFGLTKDDVGGLRYLYNRNNYANEPLLTNVTGNVLGNAPWAPYFGTNVTTTNVNATNITGGTFVLTGLRPGINKLNFRQVRYDSLLSQLFVPVTNSYTDTVITNSRSVRQSLARALTQPDLLFVAQDNGLINNLVPWASTITDTAAWQNNDAINGNDGVAGDAFGGPGVIVPQVVISFSDQFPFWLNNTPDFLEGDTDSVPSGIWGSFDENTDVPVIYPLYLDLTLADLQRLAP